MTSTELGQVRKKSNEELQNYLHFRRRSFAIRAKKGKGSYSRKQKHKYAPIAQ